MDADFGSLEANECTIQRNTLHTKWIFIYLSHTKYFQLLLLIKYESVVSGSGFSFRCRCEKCIKIYIERKVCIKVCRFKWLISWSFKGKDSKEPLTKHKYIFKEKTQPTLGGAATLNPFASMRLSARGVWALVSSGLSAAVSSFYNRPPYSAGQYVLTCCISPFGD